MRIWMLFLMAAVPVIAPADHKTSYAGQQDRAIKSLSEQEIESLRRGDGMGFAKLAELNHYPGPRHVLQLATELELSSAQLAATESLYAEMQAAAIALGNEIVSAESALDEQFRQGVIDAPSLKTALLGIGRLQARLRHVHLDAHLQQRRLLTADQVRRYDTLRGYANSDHSHGGQHTGHD